ncbi:hypothetical protein NHH03_06210 [Stieleria sp. TO1_6]|uniref:hypothetical protein n=1 Tax=Stieleria tagensis TaxID=2956795 RepID=UPI00209ACFCB|nr:hypothetical protein [Stieleria tagensis]MCO8121323.1 hypothetical protein [Stieleria tagensis]
MGIFDRVDRAPKTEARKSVFSIAEIQALLAPWCLTKILGKFPFNAAMAFEEIPDFQDRGIKKANAIGDALGHRGFGFYREQPSRKHCLASFDNASLVLQWHSDHESLAAEVGYATARDLKLALLRLEFEDLDSDDQSETAAELGFDSVDELVNAMKSVDGPSLK